jgi:hypothetical protein
MASIDYNAPKVVGEFIRSEVQFTLIIGPLGSGKSTGCSMKLLVRANAQAKDANDAGLRRTRFAIIRNTYRELMDTTKNTIEAWVPAEIRTWVEGESKFIIRYNDVYSEWLLRALDRPDDVGKLLSLDLTGAWINEAKEIPKPVFDMLTGRKARFPNDALATPTWDGIFMDSNPPDTDHWLYKTFEEHENIEADERYLYKVFHQPSGLAKDAENVEHLKKGRRNLKGQPLYYAEMLSGKTKEWVNVYVHGKYGFVQDGKPVYPEYIDELHTAPDDLVWNKTDLYLGMDFGLTPAIIVAQKTPDYQWQAIDEFVTERSGATAFSRVVRGELNIRYPRCNIRSGWGDPAGKAMMDDRTPFEIVQGAGLPIDPAPTNDFIRRRESVARALLKLTIRGKPALVISPKCKMLRKGMNGGYHFKRVQVSGTSEIYGDVPVKNQFSHPAEALQYLMVGEGMDRVAIDDEDENESYGGQRRVVVPRVHTAIGRNSRGRNQS